MTNVFERYTAKAAELAGIDILGWGSNELEEMCLVLDELRKGAPSSHRINRL